MTTGFGANDFSVSSDLVPEADFFFIEELLPIWVEVLLLLLPLLEEATEAEDFFVVADVEEAAAEAIADWMEIRSRPLEAVMRLDGLTIEEAGVMGLERLWPS